MTDFDAIVGALGREIEWSLPESEDLIAAGGEPADRSALDRALDELVRYVAYTVEEPCAERGVEVLRAALEREGVFADPAATAAAVTAAESVMASAGPDSGPRSG